MGRMKEAYERTISIIDYSDGSGDVLARTSIASMADDLIFLFDASREECPKVYDAIIELSEAYVDGGDWATPADFLCIGLRQEQ